MLIYNALLLSVFEILKINVEYLPESMFEIQRIYMVLFPEFDESLGTDLVCTISRPFTRSINVQQESQWIVKRNDRELMVRVTGLSKYA